MNYSMPGFLVHPQLLDLAQTHAHQVADVIHPTISSSVIPFSYNLQFSHIRVFSNESVFCIRWPKYWSFSFNISPSNEYSGLIFFKIDLFDIFSVQGTLKSLLQHHKFESIISLVLSFPYRPTLTSIHDYWKNNSLD